MKRNEIKFELTQNNINDLPIEYAKRSDFPLPLAGAVVTFEGRVRNHNDGLKVDLLEYQCYESMGLRIGNEIVESALGQFDIHQAYCIHRHGKLKIGDIAVWVVVSSSHRREAFKACSFIIDEIKKDLPMWKKEHYSDENIAPKWVACHECSHPHEAL